MQRRAGGRHGQRRRAPSDETNHKSLHGLTRTLIANMVEGVTKGFTKQLEIAGVGYKAEVRPYGLQLALGFSHPIEYKAPAGIKLTRAAADADRRSKARTRKWSARSRRRSAACVRPSRTRARASSTLAKSDSPQGRQGGRQVMPWHQHSEDARAAAYRRHLRVRKKVHGHRGASASRGVSLAEAHLRAARGRRRGAHARDGRRRRRSARGRRRRSRSRSGSGSPRTREGRGDHEGRVRPWRVSSITAA